MAKKTVKSASVAGDWTPVVSPTIKSGKPMERGQILTGKLDGADKMSIVVDGVSYHVGGRLVTKLSEHVGKEVRVHCLASEGRRPLYEVAVR